MIVPSAAKGQPHGTESGEQEETKKRVEMKNSTQTGVNQLASHRQVGVATQAVLNPLRAELNEKGQSNDCPLFERQSICCP